MQQRLPTTPDTRGRQKRCFWPKGMQGPSRGDEIGHAVGTLVEGGELAASLRAVDGGTDVSKWVVEVDGTGEGFDADTNFGHHGRLPGCFDDLCLRDGTRRSVSGRHIHTL